MFGELERWNPFEELSSWHRKYVVRCDLPGVDPKDMDVHAEGGLLTIKGERKTEEKVRSIGRPSTEVRADGHVASRRRDREDRGPL